MDLSKLVQLFCEPKADIFTSCRRPRRLEELLKHFRSCQTSLFIRCRRRSVKQISSSCCCSVHTGRRFTFEYIHHLSERGFWNSLVARHFYLRDAGFWNTSLRRSKFLSRSEKFKRLWRKLGRCQFDVGSRRVQFNGSCARHRDAGLVRRGRK